MSSTPESFSANQSMVDWMQEVAPFGIFTTDTDLRVSSWNQWMAEHSGLSTRETVGRPLLGLFPDLQERRLAERFQRALAGEISVLSTALHKYLLAFPGTVASAGLPHMLQTARVAPLRENGVVVGSITIIEDVTQREFQASVLNRRHELDRLLSSSLALLLQSTEPARDVADIFSRIGRTLGIDAYFCYLLAADGNNFHLNAAAGFPPRQREAIATLPWREEDRAAAPAASAPPETFCLPQHEEALDRIGLDARCCFPLVVDDRVVGFVTFAKYHPGQIPEGDIEVLARIARYIGIALDRTARERDLRAASRAKDDFLAALSHELRTPLNPVLLLASEGAVNPEFSDEAREDFRVVEKNALLEARLIDDLLDLTRIEHGKLRLDMRPGDAHVPVRDALETIRRDVAENQLVLEVNLGARPSTILSDSGRLQQVFWNVFKNAVKFTPVGGHIRVESRCDAAAREFVLEVADTGIGLEPHEVARIFGAFSQGDHAGEGRRHRFGGLGLGLAISRKLVELHSGRIEATSAGKNRGATFTIYLPLLASPEERGRGDQQGPANGDSRSSHTDA